VYLFLDNLPLKPKVFNLNVIECFVKPVELKSLTQQEKP